MSPSKGAPRACSTGDHTWGEEEPISKRWTNGRRGWLVTGGAGFIGSHLCDALTSRGDPVVILDDLSTGLHANVEHLLAAGSARLVEGSVTDAALVDELMREADACLHLASAVGVQLVVDDPLDALVRNVRGTDTVLWAAARHRRRVLFTSTSEVYGKNSQGALPEEADRVLGSPFKARWSYAIAKSYGEALAHSLHRSQAAETIVARLFNTVGPRQRARYGMVLPRFVQQALDGRELTVYGSGAQTRCFTHVHDAVRAILLLVDCDAAVGHVFNIGNPQELQIIELARRVIEQTGSSSGVRLVPYEDAYGEGFEELGHRMPDVSKLQGLVDWRPTRSVDDAIEDIVLYERAAAARRSASLAA